MRFTKKWRIALIVGLAATATAIVIAIPISTRVSPTQANVIETQQVNPAQQIVAYKEDAKPAHSKNSNVVSERSVRPPQDYYDRRREYWEDRMEHRADYLEDEEGGDDSADSEDSKDKKDSAAEDDEGDSMDEEEELIERRREYWCDRLDREWE